MKAFQIMEAPAAEKSFLLIHDSTDLFFKYFSKINLNQRPLPQRACQKDLILRDILNHSRFFIPHPPWDVGLAKVVQSAKWNFFLFPLVPQRKSKNRLFNFPRMVFQMGIKAIQNTGMLVRIALIRTSLPPNERSLKDQWEILFSNFFMSHNQSFTR